MKKSITYLIHSGLLTMLFLMSFQARSIAECNADFGYYQIPNTLVIQFVDSSSSSFEIVSWLWNFGDTHMSDNNDPDHAFAEPGSYEVCLTIHDNHDCNDTYCQVVVVEPINQGGCEALFEYEQLANTLTIHFINQSSSEFDIISRLWDFGDGSEGDGANPNHTYDEPGTYEVCLTIHDNHGCEDTYCHAVIVEPINQDGCEALFEYEQLDNSLTIHFINQSSSEFEIISRFWDFGDGSEGDGANPNHTYDEPGTYEVCLTIHDNHGCEDTYCHAVIVEPINPGTCEALFEYEQLANSLTIHFINQSSSEFEIISRFWNFGDGSEGDGANPNHTYDEPGTYEVCLTIHDNHGCEDTYCHAVIVEPINQDGCEALFEYEQPANSLSIHFINHSTSGHDIISWFWTFGDGSESDDHNPSHTYNHPGTYEVCLTIHDNVGCTDTYCHAVIVEEIVPGECEALFVYYQFENSLTIQFIDSSYSPNDITSRLWNFGDGHTGDGLNPDHHYEEPGTYEVCLTIHDNHDCTDTYCHVVIVESINPEGCNASFEYEQADNSLTIHFINHSSSEHDIISWSWTFGDGGISDNHAPTHTYDHPGTYVVCLIIQDNVGCTDTVCHEVIVEPINQGECEAWFVFYQLENSLIIQFFDSSYTPNDIISRVWNFGDGHMADGPHPDHHYEVPGSYEVCLTIHDNHGCEDTYCQVVVVEPISEPECEALFNYDQLENTLTIQFDDQSTSMHDIISWLWNFGDGSSSDNSNPAHTYNHAGTYEVCLTIHDNHECADTYCHVVHVTDGNEPCHASFEASLDSAGLVVHFDNTSSNTTEHTTYYWTFGDGETSNDENPVHTYSESGNYTVCLIIQDSTIDCVADYCLVISVHESQGANYEGDNIAEQNVRKAKEIPAGLGTEHFVAIYPNPFSAMTTVHYELKKDEEVNIELNDLFGNRIRQYHQGFLSKGVYTQAIDGSYLNPGIYLVRMTIGSEMVIKKITISR